MTARRLTVLALVGLLATAALAQTGTPESVVLEDPDGDAPAIADLLGVRINDTGPRVNVTLLLNETPPSPGLQTCGPAPACQYIGPDLRFHLRFRLSDADNATLGPESGTPGTYHLLAWFNNTDSPWQFLLLHEDPDGNGVVNQPVPFNVTDGAITWSLPLGSPAFPVPAEDRSQAYRITELWAASEAWLCFSQAGCAQAGEPEDPTDPFSVLPLDRAPDNGTNGTYTFAYTPPPEPTPTPDPTPTATPEPEPEPDPEPVVPQQPEEPPRSPYDTPTPRPDPSQEETQGLPAPAFLAVAAMLAALVAVRRRQP